MASLLTQLMDDFYAIANQTPAEDAPQAIMRRAGAAPSNVAAMEALARLLTIESARRRHAEARLAEMGRRQQEEADGKLD